MFSGDYTRPLKRVGCEWWNGDAVNVKKALGGIEGYKAVGRENTKKKLLKLGKFHDSEAEVV
jgi:2,3-dihydroxybenzoate decarboxylase